MKKYKPEFKLLQQLIRAVGVAVITYIMFGSESVKSPSGPGREYDAALIPFVTILIYICVMYLKYIFTTFMIFEDKVQSVNNFVILQAKMIRIRDIKEVTISQWPLQMILGIGTVKITNYVTSKDAGIVMYNIKEYQEVYDYLNQKRL